MALPIFDPPMRPSTGTAITPEVSLRETPFGDGYTQNSPAGLNHIRRVIRFRWNFLSLDEAQQIDRFLVERGGYKPFLYRVRGEDVDRRWTCSQWAVEDGHPAKVTATFKEDFSVE